MKAKQLKMAFAQDRAEVCRCGQPKDRCQIVCRFCYQAAPQEVKEALAHGDYITRPAAIRRLLDLAGTKLPGKP